MRMTIDKEDLEEIEKLKLRYLEFLEEARWQMLEGRADLKAWRDVFIVWGQVSIFL